MKQIAGLVIALLFLISLAYAQKTISANIVSSTTSSATSTTSQICPAVCVPLWNLENSVCTLDSCGSGCGENNITTFKTKEQCEAEITTTTIPETAANPSSAISSSSTTTLPKIEKFKTQSACLVREPPNFPPKSGPPDAGKSFAKKEFPLVLDFESSEEAIGKTKETCADSIYQTLQQSYCNVNKNAGQWEVLGWGPNGNLWFNSCARFDSTGECGYHFCLEEKTTMTTFLTTVTQPKSEKNLAAEFVRGNSYADGGLVGLNQPTCSGNNYDSKKLECVSGPLDISNVKSIIIKAKIKVIYNTLEGSGWWSDVYKGEGEYPARFLLFYSYTDPAVEDGRWVWGFLPKKNVNTLTNYNIVNYGEWAEFTSGNIMNYYNSLSQKPRYLHRIQASANGWDYASRFDDIKLIIDGKEYPMVNSDFSQGQAGWISEHGSNVADTYEINFQEDNSETAKPISYTISETTTEALEILPAIDGLKESLGEKKVQELKDKARKTIRKMDVFEIQNEKDEAYMKLKFLGLKESEEKQLVSTLKTISSVLEKDLEDSININSNDGGTISVRVNMEKLKTKINKNEKLARGVLSFLGQ
ncbi:MAG TPA: hypothetical protein VI933_03755 [archaeon]|nr:hypothetical protein [archaeon]